VRLPNKRLFRSCVGLAIAIAQFVVVLATAAESLRLSASAHVEQRGTQSHYAHNEATCPVCAAQSMHARVESYPPPLPVSEHGVVALVERVDRTAVGRTLTANGSRAPPALS
jgi:hypothetical protein